MKINLTTDEVKQIASTGDYDIIPICTELLSDIKTPVQVLRSLMNVSEHCYMLESVEDNERWGRYSFLGFEPKFIITCCDGKMRVGDKEFQTDNPDKHIRDVLSKYKSPVIEGMPTFTGGLVGYFSYDYLKYSEPTLRLDAKDTEGFKDVDLMLFDKVIVFDNLKSKIILIANVSTQNINAGYGWAVEELRRMEELVRHGEPKKDIGGHMTSEIKPLFSKEEYCGMVEKAKHHIYEGDIFQIVLSNRLEAEYEGSLLNTYRVLRTLNPSPYMFYFSGTDMEVAGASPETLVKLENGVLHTFPLAGTRPRGKTAEEDAQLEKELLADPKELAEHNMLVDLGRNDIGKISEFNSVKVTKYQEVLRYSKIMHICSEVEGKLKDGLDAFDAIESLLPAGTLSGAPKIRACEIIEELERTPRGVYGGALGYVDFNGNLDTCIAIRMAVKKNDKVYVQAGAGIVADSVPESEYEETYNKALAVMNAVKNAGEVNAL